MDIQKIQAEVLRRNQLINALTRQHPQLLEDSRLSVIPQATLQATQDPTHFQPDMDLQMNLLKRVDQLMAKARGAKMATNLPPKKQQFQIPVKPKPPPQYKFQPQQTQDQLVLSQQSDQIKQGQDVKKYPVPVQPNKLIKQAVKKLKEIKQNLASRPLKPQQPALLDLEQVRSQSLEYSMSISSMVPLNFMVQKDQLLNELYAQEQAIMEELAIINSKLNELN